MHGNEIKEQHEKADVVYKKEWNEHSTSIMRMTSHASPAFIEYSKTLKKNKFYLQRPH